MLDLAVVKRLINQQNIKKRIRNTSRQMTVSDPLATWFSPDRGNKRLNPVFMKMSQWLAAGAGNFSFFNNVVTDTRVSDSISSGLAA